MIGARLAGAVGLTVGLAMALAANLTATWPQGPVMIGTGLAAPLVLPLALWIRASFVPSYWLSRLVRELSILAVATPAAALSYWHTYSLMVGHGVPWVIAASLPLSADGVATVSTLALHHGRTPRHRGSENSRARHTAKSTARITAPHPRGLGSSNEAPKQTGPRLGTPPPRIDSTRDTMAYRVAWLQGQTPGRAVDEIAALISQFDCSQSTAKRVRRAAGRTEAAS